ncbi:MAG TPA: GNAT family N-acetyltransferase [Ktedonobacterales bacterium]
MTSEPPIRLATDVDLDALAAMRAAEGWLVNRDLLDLLHHARRARLFVIPHAPTRSAFALDDAGGRSSLASSVEDGPLAAVSAVAYGPIGFIGNVIVAPQGRGRGLGAHIMRHVIAWLAGEGVRRVELDATPEGRRLYERLGFVPTERSWIVEGTPAALDRRHLADRAHGSTHTLMDLRPGALAVIAAVDRAALGGDRLDLLDALLAQPGVWARAAVGVDGNADGYLVARPMASPPDGLHVGPWVCRSPAVAAALLADVVSAKLNAAGAPLTPEAPLHAVVPGAARSALAFARAIGLTPIPDDMRMRLAVPAHGGDSDASDPIAADTTLVYAMLAPMVG